MVGQIARIVMCHYVHIFNKNIVPKMSNISVFPYHSRADRKNSDHIITSTPPHSQPVFSGFSRFSYSVQNFEITFKLPTLWFLAIPVPKMFSWFVFQPKFFAPQFFNPPSVVGSPVAPPSGCSAPEVELLLSKTCLLSSQAVCCQLARAQVIAKQVIWPFCQLSTSLDPVGHQVCNW